MEKAEEETKPSSGSSGSINWSEEVEDLLAAGDTETAISLLESTISKLENEESSTESINLQLASALTNLANLYSSKGFSLKSDQLLSRAFEIRNAKVVNKDLKGACRDSAYNSSSTNGDLGKSAKSPDYKFTQDGSSDDDWEAVADRTPDELLSTQSLPEVSKLSLKDPKVQAPKRRGRGTFSYKRNELYSDWQDDKSVVEDTEDEDVCLNSESNSELRHANYGTRHVLVLADFSPRTKTIDLEKLLEDFRDRGVVVRWVNDTTALAVFRTPSIALEAYNCIHFPFTVRILNEDDILLGSISKRELEPPRPRPKTSAQTAQRLIAHGMGLKLPSAGFGSREMKNQEAARRNRIQTRQNLRDDAWGPEDTN